MPPYPGEFLNPYPLGTTITLYSIVDSTFAVAVNAATIDATAEVEAVTDPHTGQPVNGPPPTGDQYTLVNLSLTSPAGWGPSSVPDFLEGVSAEGTDSVMYKPGSCVPPPLDLGSIGTVDSGQTMTGNLCFTIASTDASTLELSGTAVVGKAGFSTPVWFALR